MTSTDLKPCPFDRGRAELVVDTGHKFPCYVRCAGCHARTANYRTESVARNAWNMRSQELGDFIKHIKDTRP